MKYSDSNNNYQNEYHRQGNTRKNKKLNLENSPDSEKFDKSVEELTKYIRENSTNENDLLKMEFNATKKSKNVHFFHRYIKKK